MTKTRMVTYLVVLALACGVVAGCGGGPDTKVPTVKVSGIIKVDGTPAEGVAVFFNKTVDHIGNGLTDASGKYECRAEVGENKLYFSKKKESNLTPEEELLLESTRGTGDPTTQGADPDQLLPPKYSDAAKCTLTFNVPEGGSSEANFELTTK